MPKLIDLTGRKYHYLTVEHRVSNNKHNQVVWVCRCECGKLINLIAQSLKSGNTKSCGCKSKKLISELHKKHGHGIERKHTPEYSSWHTMIQRCTNSKNTNYPHYGGRGIKVCERWREFENFLEDMGNRPSTNHSLDRIDVNGNYEPSNCRWATIIEQSRNKTVRKDNPTGVIGVTIRKDTGKYIPSITINRKTIRLGSFDNLEDAIKVRKEAEIKYWN